MDLLLALLISIASQLGISNDQAKQTATYQQQVDQQLRDGLITETDVNTFSLR